LERRQHRACYDSVLRVGKFKLMQIRVVGTREVKMPADVEGSTIRCSCQRIYEFYEIDLRPRASTT